MLFVTLIYVLGLTEIPGPIDCLNKLGTFHEKFFMNLNKYRNWLVYISDFRIFDCYIMCNIWIFVDKVYKKIE